MNVYDIISKNNLLNTFGMGIFHTGIEVNEIEYAYGGNSLFDGPGVYMIEPRSHEAFTFRTSIEVGYVVTSINKAKQTNRNYVIRGYNKNATTTHS